MSEWIHADRPALRIVPQKLWDSAQERLGRSRALYLTRTSNGQLAGKPKAEGGIESSASSMRLMEGELSPGIGSFGGIVRRVYGFQVPEDEIEQLNAYAEFLNAEAEAMARPLFDAGLPVDGGTPEKIRHIRRSTGNVTPG